MIRATSCGAIAVWATFPVLANLRNTAHFHFVHAPSMPADA
jgi:hypothetical protein